MLERIEREPAEVAGGGVAELVCHPCVRCLMHGERKQYYRQCQKQTYQV